MLGKLRCNITEYLELHSPAKGLFDSAILLYVRCHAAVSLYTVAVNITAATAWHARVTAMTYRRRLHMQKTI